MKRALILVLLFNLFALIGNTQENLNPDLFGTGNWDADSLGNHRAIIKVEKSANIVWAHIPWRRRDFNPEEKTIIIVDAITGKQVTNILPVSINREFGDILFQPVTVPGEYYVYYLKHFMHGRSNYPNVTYPAFQSKTERNWLAKAETSAKKLNGLEKSKLVQFQSIDPFNSFYPMEIIATKSEVDDLIKKNPGSDYFLFPEKRENSIRMTSDIPLKWIQDGITGKFTGKALKGEYFTFQIGVFAAQKKLENIEVQFTDLFYHDTIAANTAIFSSFNTEGTDWKGNHFKKKCDVDKGKVQALWIGVQIPENIEAGEYKSKIQIKPGNSVTSEIELHLIIPEETILAHGDDEPGRMTRLRWLNSTLAEDNGIVAPYSALELKENTVKLLGREVKFGKNGFPESIKSYYNESVTKIQEKGREILSAPVNLVVETNNKNANWKNPTSKIVKQKEGAIAWEIGNEMQGFTMIGTAQIEFDGNIDYQLVLTATEDISVNDIRLEIPMQKGTSKYMMGLGQKGGFRPEQTNWKWAVEKNQDGPWIGDVNAGLQARFRDNNYSRPLNTNFYLKKPLYMPDSWYNNGNGGITIQPAGTESVLISAYSGKRMVKKGEQLHFYFNILVTPFRPVNNSEHWKNRYYHSYQPIDTVIAFGANTINVHHANKINPFINYPFFRPNQMKAYIDEAHSKDLKVKIYYTVRELTNKAPELFMLRSLGDEIFSNGNGGGFSWLQEHLDSNYIAAWFVPDLQDAAVVNTGISRWHNFYIEGLNWLVKNVEIDGLYIDDLAFDRTSMKRIRKVLERGNPGALIDLHSANQFNVRDGFANSANLYLEHFPYIDRLWFGEYFDYNLRPDFWLIETSGIPFGLMGEMLQDGGNPWRGMVFGMTSRAPWSGNPSALWKVWDDFEIEKSDMVGYWDSGNPVKTNSADTYATAYVQKGKQTLIALATWAENDDKINLGINWESLGINPAKAEFYLPAIDKFQDEKHWSPKEPVVVPKGKGFLIIVREKK